MGLRFSVHFTVMVREVMKRTRVVGLTNITLKALMAAEVCMAAGKSPVKNRHQKQLKITVLYQSFGSFILIMEWNVLFWKWNYIFISPSMTNSLREADLAIEGLQV